MSISIARTWSCLALALLIGCADDDPASERGDTEDETATSTGDGMATVMGTEMEMGMVRATETEMAMGTEMVKAMAMVRATGMVTATATAIRNLKWRRRALD